MKNYFLFAIFFAIQTLAQNQAVLDIKHLSDSLLNSTENNKITNVRLFLKSSGENWEQIQNCGGIDKFNSENWYNQLRLEDLNRIPKNSLEAYALELARESLLAISQGNDRRALEIQKILRNLSTSLTSCGIDYSSMTSDVELSLVKARLQLGSEIKKIFLNGNKSDRRLVYFDLIDCQRIFQESKNGSLNCFSKLLPHASESEIEGALSRIKEAAILTLLLERNQNPPCFHFPRFTKEEKEDYDAASLFSPLFDRLKEHHFQSYQLSCQSQ